MTFARTGRYLVFLLVFFAVPAHAATLVNINTATSVELDALPGIGPSKAAAIIDYRTEHGSFAKIEDVQNVSGIGPVTFANLKDQITVSGATTISNPPPPAQPAPPPASSHTVKAVESAQITAQGNFHEKEDLVAPTTTNDLGAVGAPVPTPKESFVHAVATSSWTVGFLGLLVFAGGALLIL